MAVGRRDAHHATARPGRRHAGVDRLRRLPFQIYFDFSAYSDMAIGLGRMFGFHFLENFSCPYIATSVTDFWRRWHMSLSHFFRDYVYIPLGGNRVPRSAGTANLWSSGG